MTRARLAAENHLDRTSPGDGSGGGGAGDHGSVVSGGSSNQERSPMNASGQHQQQAPYAAARGELSRSFNDGGRQQFQPPQRAGEAMLFPSAAGRPDLTSGWSDPWETSSACAAGLLGSPSSDSGNANAFFPNRGRCHSAEAGVPPRGSVASPQAPPGMGRLRSRTGYEQGDHGDFHGDMSNEHFSGDYGGGSAFLGDDSLRLSMPPLSSPARTTRPRLHTTGGLGGYNRPTGLPTIESFSERESPLDTRRLSSGDRMLSTESNDLPSSMAEAVLESITSRGGPGDRPCPSPSPFLGGPGMFSLSLDFLRGGSSSCPPPPGLVPSSGSSEEMAPRALRLGSSESTFSDLRSNPSNLVGSHPPLPDGTSSRSWGEDHCVHQNHHHGALGAGTNCDPNVDGAAYDLGDLLRISPGPPLRGRAATEPATSSSGADVGLLPYGPPPGGYR